ncbi:hypothetical protein BY458DRAFT_89763 [Sporodiniella umbellata]|nr:hypothetical protein BY458DRAFT_89763 [Sporodiniella umbellata]
MFDGLKTEQEIWKNCINMILSLLEDSLFNDLNPTPKDATHILEYLKDDRESTTSSPPTTPSFKRKRSTSGADFERKMQKLSSSLANDIARSLSVGDGDNDQEMNFEVTKPNGDLENPVPTLRRISLSGTNQPSPCSIEQWKRRQADNHNVSFEKYIEVSEESQKLLRKELENLQTPNQTFEQLSTHLRQVLKLADELSGDHTLNFMVSWSFFFFFVFVFAIYFSHYC